MLSFESDYIQGAHPEILNRLVETNFDCESGYGADRFCDSAKQKIRQACNCPYAQIQFLVGGTQSNQIVIDSLLKSYQGVVAVDTGHVSLHEAGAIEYTGHKVIQLKSYNGKMRAEDLKSYITTFYADESHEHMVFPGMVYISHPTEYGTLYTKSELESLSDVCREYSLPLFLDGARLGYGIASYDTDVTLSDIAKYCDVFYIGGTKVGALCGEAVVFTRNNMPKHFMAIVKQHGALVAKGRLLGVQFDTLFTDDLYFKISRHAIDQAERLKTLFIEKGYKLYCDSPTNQQFPIIENNKLEELRENVVASFWEKYDDNHTVMRFATSWATTPQSIDQLAEYL